MTHYTSCPAKNMISDQVRFFALAGSAAQRQIATAQLYRPLSHVGRLKAGMADLRSQFFLYFDREFRAGSESKGKMPRVS
jgi:hypothetical protein